MDFTEAERQRNQLTARMQGGQMTPAAYTEAVNTLRVTDPSGRTWQPNPGGTGWLVWNGTAWQPGTPPGTGSPGTGPGGRAKDFNEFKGSLMTVDEFRKMSKETPLAKRPQRWWDLLSILGGIVGAIIWIVYSGIREGIDVITPLLMIAIPVALVWFRADIDVMLLPLQPHRKKVSRLVLIGCGIALPFLTAFILFTIGIRNYPLMYTNMLIGTFGAYALTRDPVLAAGRQPARTGGAMPSAITVLAGLALVSLLVPFVRADDCTRDILNAQDCLRTDGFAEAIAGFFSTLISILVNGPIIIQGILQGAAGAAGGAAAGAAEGAGAGVQPPAAPQGPFVGDKMTFVDARGETRTAVLQADGHWLTDQGTWYDPDYDAFLADQRAKDAEIAAWKAKAEAESAAAQAAIDAAKKLRDAPRIDPVTGKKILTPAEQRRFDFLNKQKDAYAEESAAWTEYGDYLDGIVTKLEWLKWGCDKSIDVLSQVTGPAGKTIAKVYKVGTNLGEGLGEGMAEGGNYGSHIAKGAAKAAVDLASDALVDKGFGKLGEKLGESGRAGQVVNWLNKEIKVNPDPMAIRIFSSPKTEIAARALGNAGKGWIKGFGPGYATDFIKDRVIGK